MTGWARDPVPPPPPDGCAGCILGFLLTFAVLGLVIVAVWLAR